jgi:hypothetical protein
MLNALPYAPSPREQARYEQATTYDYGRVGDQRPYQIVFPAYKAPKFLETFHTLEQGLRECGTLCRLKGIPFRLVKWGGKVPCVPCGTRIRDNRLPGFKVVYSKGALEGFPDAMPIADFLPNGEKVIYGPNGDMKKVGEPSFAVAANPYPFIGKYTPRPPTMRYLDAIRSAMYLAEKSGRTAYLVSSFGDDSVSNPDWFPVVYVQPGGIVARYPHDADLGKGSIPNNTNAVTSVLPSEYRELVAEGQGATFLGQGA